LSEDGLADLSVLNSPSNPSPALHEAPDFPPSELRITHDAYLKEITSHGI